MRRLDCGGCRGLGAHVRWCPAVVGLSASVRGRQAEGAESLADSVGSNNVIASNLLYQASALLRADAQRLAEQFKEQESNG